MTRPRGSPLPPRAMSRLMAPVEIPSMAREAAPSPPMVMMAPSPNCFSICLMALFSSSDMALVPSRTRVPQPALRSLSEVVVHDANLYKSEFTRISRENKHGRRKKAANHRGTEAQRRQRPRRQERNGKGPKPVAFSPRPFLCVCLLCASVTLWLVPFLQQAFDEVAGLLRRADGSVELGLADGVEQALEARPRLQAHPRQVVAGQQRRRGPGLPPPLPPPAPARFRPA